MAEERKDTAPERRIQAQIDNSGPKDARKTGITKAEQYATQEEVPDSATLARGYWKWTDNNGRFHKVPIDGTNAIREPAHEQHELTVEDRDRLYEAAALKTPRRDPAEAQKIHDVSVRNDDVHEALSGEGSKPVTAKRGEIDDGKDYAKDPAIEVGTPAAEVRGAK